MTEILVTRSNKSLTRPGADLLGLEFTDERCLSNVGVEWHSLPSAGCQIPERVRWSSNVSVNYSRNSAVAKGGVVRREVVVVDEFTFHWCVVATPPTRMRSGLVSGYGIVILLKPTPDFLECFIGPNIIRPRCITENLTMQVGQHFMIVIDNQRVQPIQPSSEDTSLLLAVKLGQHSWLTGLSLRQRSSEIVI